MSRIGRMPIKIPEKVNVKMEDNCFMVSGPLGRLEQEIVRGIGVEVKDKEIHVFRKKESKKIKAFHGLMRSLIANMVQGVTEGFSKTLELHGTGYRVKLEQGKLVLQVGFSHPVVVEPPEGIKFEVKGEKEIKVAGIDKQLVGNTAAAIRQIKKPDSYKGKGIRYQGEVIKLKPGKAAKAGEAKYE